MFPPIFINQSVNYLTIDIVNAYANKYDSIKLVAGRILKSNRPLSDKVKIASIVCYKKTSLFQRVTSWLIAAIQIFFILLFQSKHSLIVYVTNPPFSYFASLLLPNPFIIIMYDIYPDALKAISITPQNILYRGWSQINKYIFRKAEHIYTLSDGMGKQLMQYVDENKISIIPNWSTMGDIVQIDRDDNPFVKKYKLANKFIIMYSGNIGYTHNVEIIMEMAKRLINEDNIRFVIIGNGGKKQTLVQLVATENLHNCQFLDWQPESCLSQSLSAADLSIVTLATDVANVSVPSKTYNLLAVGSPLLCIAPRASEIGRLVEKEKCGACYDSTEVDAMVNFIIELRNNPNYRKELSFNARKASKQYTYKNAEQYVWF